jgi:hypothetical protein
VQYDGGVHDSHGVGLSRSVAGLHGDGGGAESTAPSGPAASEAGPSAFAVSGEAPASCGAAASAEEPLPFDDVSLAQPVTDAAVVRRATLVMHRPCRPALSIMGLWLSTASPGSWVGLG